MTLATITASAGLALTSVLGYAGTTIGFVMETPILAVFAVFAIATFGIGIARSFIKGV